MRKGWSGSVAAGVVVMSLSCAVAGQTRGGGSWASIGPTGPQVVRDVTPPIQAQMERDIRRRREEKLVADAERMVVLAKELKAEIDRGATTSLSVGAIKKAEEMEKLARGVKKSLKN